MADRFPQEVVLRDGKLAFDIEGEDREPGAPVIESPAAEEGEVAPLTVD